MSYTKTVWEDRYIETPNTYTITENQDNTVTLTESTGAVYTEGTPVNATNMNKIEDELELLDSKAVEQVETVYNQKIYSQQPTVSMDLTKYKRILIHFAVYDESMPENTGGASHIAMLDLQDSPSYDIHKINVFVPYISGSTVQTNFFKAMFMVNSEKTGFYCAFWYTSIIPITNTSYYVSKIEGVF